MERNLSRGSKCFAGRYRGDEARFCRLVGPIASADLAIAKQLALGHRTSQVAERFRLSTGRISQIRRQLESSWRTYQGEELDTKAAAA